MRLSEFSYDLPEGLIAQEPAERRDGSRLMVVPTRGSAEHRSFTELPTLLVPGDVLVLNDTRVIPARLRGRKDTGGRVEVLLDRPLDDEQQDQGGVRQRWTCLLQSSRPVREGARILLPAGAEAVREAGSGQPVLHLRLPRPAYEYLDQHGEVPLPVYIRRRAADDPRFTDDRIRYQTVYAREPGAVAAPTAGLHFTDEILELVRAAGVEVVRITLHVGPGTFLPVRCDEVSEHRMHSERYRVPAETAASIERARNQGRRIVAVGTTVVRALESAGAGGTLQEGAGDTDLFIRPGYSFRVVDALLTNFHLPRSTLLMLVCALAGTEPVLGAYREAVSGGYRFYSYGDAMFLHRNDKEGS